MHVGEGRSGLFEGGEIAPSALVVSMPSADLPVTIRRGLTGAGGVPPSPLALAAMLARRLPVWLEEERRFGHGFLFAPVLAGLGALAWFSAPLAVSVIPLAIALCASLGIATFAVSASARRLFVIVSLLIAGMLLAGIETWRHSTLILDSPVTTTINGVVRRGEAMGAGMRYLVDLRSTSDPTLRRPPQTVSIVVRARHSPLENGALIAGRARLSPPSGPALPGLHDFSFSAYFDGIGAVGHLYGRPQQVGAPVTEAGWSARLDRWLFSLRAMIGDRIRATVPGDAGAFAAAIVTDERRAISEKTVEALRISGLAHIVAISGLNMALAAGISFVGLRMVLALIPGVAQALPVKKIAAVGALALTTGYYLISGFGVSAQRAYIVMAIMLVAVLLDRPSISLRNVALAALVVIALSPSEILGASFQMSFAATAALVAGYAAWARRAERRQHEPFPLRHWIVTAIGSAWAFVAGIVMTSLIGSLATAMFSIEHFHRLATYGLAANLAAMPIISFVVMPAGLAGMLLMPLGLDGPFMRIMGQGLSLVIEIAEHVAGWGGDIAVGQQHPLFLSLGVSALILLCLLSTPLRYAGLPLAIAAIGLFLLYPRPMPDLAVSEDGTLVIARRDDVFAINRTRPPNFIFGQWQRALRLSDPITPTMLDTEEPPTTSPPDDRRLSRQAIDKARADMRQAASQYFICQPRAWCSIRLAADLLVAVVEDGRYVGAACDVAVLVIAARSRFTDCRSGARLLNAATLRKTGALEIYFEASGKHSDAAIAIAGQGVSQTRATLQPVLAKTRWRIRAAVTDTLEPWSFHRRYDWRSNAYDGSLPTWFAASSITEVPTQLAPAKNDYRSKPSQQTASPPSRHAREDAGQSPTLSPVSDIDE